MSSVVSTAWVAPPRQTTGLDHLAVRAVSEAYYAELVPCVTNVTDRIRSYAFYPWVLNSLDRESLPQEDERDRILGDEGRVWLEKHLDWAEEVLTAPALPGDIRAGSVVRFTIRGEQKLSIVLEVHDANAVIVDRSTGEPRKFRRDRLEQVGRL